jgi:hypothetical protein
LCPQVTAVLCPDTSYLFFCPAHDGLGNPQGLAIFLMTYRQGKTGIASEHSKAGEARSGG